MAIEIFWGSGSPFSWRVLLTAELKRIPWESRLLEFSKGEHKAPAFLAISPRAQVPALRDGDFVMAESIAMMAYLDRKYPAPPLFGETPAETGRVWQAVMACALYLDGPGDSFILPLYRGQTAGVEDALRAAIVRIHDELARWEAALAAGPWLVLPTISAADVAVYPMIKSVLRAASKPAAAAFDTGLLPLHVRYPRLAAWMTQIEALPGYDRTYPPHWR
jgi:glutathione S-transferase